MKKYVVLPILWVPEEAQKDKDLLEELGLPSDVKVNEMEQVDTAFFHIDTIIRYVREGKDCVIIHSGENEYVVPLSFEKVLSMINNLIES